VNLGQPKKVPRSGAERMRVYRRRRRNQWIPVRVELTAGEIDVLVKRGYLDPKDRDDLGAIGRAATAVVTEALIDA
jgi:hypothetical protein